MRNLTDKLTNTQKMGLKHSLKNPGEHESNLQKRNQSIRRPQWEDYEIYPIFHKDLTNRLEELSKGSMNKSFRVKSIPMDQLVETCDYEKIISQDQAQKIPDIHKIYLFTVSPHNYFFNIGNKMIVKVNKRSKKVSYLNFGGIVEYTGALFKATSSCYIGYPSNQYSQKS